jgi:hypothetical protein
MFPQAIFAQLCPLNSEKSFSITMLLTLGGSPPVILFHLAPSPPGPTGVWPFSGARSIATHAWSPSPSPSPNGVFLTSMLIWWALYSTVIISIIFLLLLIVCPSGWKPFPFSEMSAAACAKALTFTWISCFGVPETITSDHGQQFTSNLWLQLCEMLNICCKQSSAYHPESNGAVERQHRHLKDAFCARAAAATWSEELPFVLFGLRVQPREDTVFPLLRQFSVHKLFCQIYFCKMMNFQLTPLSKIFPKPCMFLPLLCLGTILAPTCPASCQPSCSPPPLSGSIRAAWFHPFSHSTTAPTQSCATAPAPSQSESGHGTRWSPSATSRPACA